jgi:hypothetical protein
MTVCQIEHVIIGIGVWLLGSIVVGLGIGAIVGRLDDPPKPVKQRQR